MLPASLHDFLIASVGASASFIGLLFVALQFVMDRAYKSGAVARRDRVMAESAYLALLSIFFISMAGLLPGGDVSWALCVTGILGVSSTLTPTVRGLKREKWGFVPRTLLLVVYGSMAIYGFMLITNLAHTIDLGTFYTIIFVLYGVAVGRAWSLSGLEDR